MLNINLSTRYGPIKSDAKRISRIASSERRHHRISNTFNHATVNSVNNTLSNCWSSITLDRIWYTSKRTAFFFTLTRRPSWAFNFWFASSSVAKAASAPATLPASWRLNQAWYKVFHLVKEMGGHIKFPALNDYSCSDYSCSSESSSINFMTMKSWLLNHFANLTWFNAKRPMSVRVHKSYCSKLLYSAVQRRSTWHYWFNREYWELSQLLDKDSRTTCDLLALKNPCVTYPVIFYDYAHGSISSAEPQI